MKYQAHRGVGTEFPENTMPAFKAAAAQGYEYIELDPRFTKDGYLVVMHDETINRTCRYPSGEKIENPTYISALTYDEILKYDAGIAKATKFKGTKVPLLSDVLAFASKAGLTVKLDNRIQSFSDEQTEVLYEIVKNSAATVAFTSSDISYIEKTAARFPNAEIHYDGYVDEEKLKAVKSAAKGNPLTVWLCLKSPITSWVTVPDADDALCKTVKRYADLGLWLLYTDEQAAQAEIYGANIIETTGSIKPTKTAKGLINCHTHTKFSHDSVCEPTDSYNIAKEKGLAGFAVTDHCDIEYSDSYDVNASALNLPEIGSFVFCGIEIGEALWRRNIADNILNSSDFDIVLGSIHAVRYSNYTMPFSGIDFSKFSKAQIGEYLNTYFTDMLETIEKCDFDVLSHLTNPLKYITGKYGIKVDLNDYSVLTDKILKAIIDKGIALEINTACLGSSYNELMPEKPIIKRYKELGGYLVTIGSDAHTADRISHGLKETALLLKEIGFKKLYYYKSRIPMQYSLEVFK